MDLRTVTAMDWVQDMTARWMRILGADSGGRTAVDEAVNQVNAIFEPAGKKTGRGRLRRRAPAQAETPAVTVLCRQLIAGALVSDLLVDRLCAQTGQDRAQVLAELPRSLAPALREGQLRALQAELAGGSELLNGPGRASYSGLGSRIENLLRLAEEQAAELIEAARAEADEITATARTRKPCPHCGAPSTPEQ